MTTLKTADRLWLGLNYADLLIRLGGAAPSEAMFDRTESALAFVQRMSDRLASEQDEPGGLSDAGAVGWEVCHAT